MIEFQDNQGKFKIKDHFMTLNNVKMLFKRCVTAMNWKKSMVNHTKYKIQGIQAPIFKSKHFVNLKDWSKTVLGFFQGYDNSVGRCLLVIV